MKKKKLLVIIPWLEKGGSEYLLLDILSEISKKYLIILILTEESTNPLIFKYKKIANFIFDYSSLKDPIVFGRNISNLIKMLSIDRILTSNSKISYESAKYFKGAIRYDTLHNNSPEGHIKKAVSASKYITKHIVVSPNIKSSLLSKKVQKNKIVEINNAVPPQFFYRQDRFSIEKNKKKLKIKQDRLVLGFFGRASPEKRPLLFLQEFYKLSKVRSVHAVILSSGPLEESMTKYIKHKKIGNKITWLKTLERKNLVKYYNVLDLLVNSSSIEGQPLTILEAHLCGIPFISFDIGGIRKMTDGKHSILLSNGESLYKKLCVISENKSIIQNMKKELSLKLNSKKKDYSAMILKYKKVIN
jgi:glycosyltransferase involved in cell wall biosynthesis